MNNPKSPCYPVFWVESKKRRSFSTYGKVNRRSGFTTFSQLPRKKQFTRGKCFDASGVLFLYDGSAGAPRFNGMTKTVLENLILPSILGKVIEHLRYFGPKLISSSSMDLETFKLELFSAIIAHGRSDCEELQFNLSEANNFKAAINAAENWQFHSGQRDADGHPRHLEDGTKNPEYVPENS
ncbi:hypothetical protein SAMN05444287_2274 [Octadecabacter temperatus]|uniref:Uncharacterized protein n=1 Tax=Octadecabacter temperatus TaxID=1458307 RepID=A0A0K0Y1N3_9RHOB|nr:hypothetical protein [Octadecabacter temperatus]AKS44812.1 hypothetical protein OSB_02430 [Octadecabacter temperatus]SIO34992.1 hypothetical protein SAMN05444287_2274 [Octadecabacter temperatus]